MDVHIGKLLLSGARLARGEPYNAWEVPEWHCEKILEESFASSARIDPRFPTYLGHNGQLAWPNLHPGEWSRAELKMECLRRVQQGGVAGFDKEVLVNWIQTYVQLSGEDAVEYQRLLALKRNKEIRQMDQTWLGKAEARGFEKGKAVGLKKGKTEGKAEAVDQMRRMVLGRIEQRFGAVPDPVQTKVRTIASIETLVKLLEKLPSLQSVDDLLPRRNGQPKSTA